MAANILGSLIGLPIAIGSQIPRLRRNQQERDALRRIQQGGGAGSRIARLAADDAARNARSIAAGGSGPSKAFAARVAMRAAQEERRQGAALGAITAAREQQFATQALSRIDRERRAAIGQIGAAGAGALAQLNAQQMAAKDNEGELAEQEAQRAHELEKLRLLLGTGDVVGTSPATNSNAALSAPASTTPSTVAESAPLQSPPVSATPPPPVQKGGSRGMAQPPPSNPIQTERDLVRTHSSAALSSPAAALMAGAGMTPDEILGQIDPETLKRRRSLALQLMLRDK